MYFELYPGLWISDYTSLPTLFKYKIDGIINLTKHKVNKQIPFTIEKISSILYQNSSKNIVYLISKTSQIEYLIKYLTPLPPSFTVKSPGLNPE